MLRHGRLALRHLRRGGWINVESFAATANELSNIESSIPQCFIQRQTFPGRHIGMTGDRVHLGVPHNPKEEESKYRRLVQDVDAGDRKVIESTINIPDMDVLKSLNPEVASIMELHEQSQRELAGKRIADMVEREFELQNGGKKVNVTKTSLMKLKVNVLRDVLERAGGDPRGNKGVLVERILDEMRKEQENTDIRSVSEHLSEGVALRKQIVKFSKLKDLHAGKGKVPVSQAQLEQAQEDATSEASVFSKVFSGPDEVAQLLVDAKAGDVVMINVMGKCTFTDYMVIASGRSHQMVRMLAEAILYELKKRCKEVAPGVAPSIEGSDDPTPEWLVVDAGSIVVHVFHEDVRPEYNLEELWGNETNTTRVAVPYTNATTLNTIQ